MTAPATRTASLSAARAARLDAAYRRRGATARSWICESCGADVDSPDLWRHLTGHRS